MTKETDMGKRLGRASFAFAALIGMVVGAQAQHLIHMAELDEIKAHAREQGQRDGYREGITWRVDGPSAVDYWQRQGYASGYEFGYEQAIKAAVQRVEGLTPRTFGEAGKYLALRSVIAAIKGQNSTETGTDAPHLDPCDCDDCRRWAQS
jgi:hypothetical protein